MASVVVVDDHLLRDILTGEREPDLGGIAPEGVATTGLWFFRLCSSLADPGAAGKLCCSRSPAYRLTLRPDSARSSPRYQTRSRCYRCENSPG